MEAAQRRYRRPQMVEMLSKKENSSRAMSKQEMRKLLTERRCVIGPNGEEIRIPKHMCVEDIIKVIKDEYGLTTSEIAGILVVLKRFESNPEFCGKVNRVVASGIESPLKIERIKQQDKEEATELGNISDNAVPHQGTSTAPNNVLPYDRVYRNRGPYQTPWNQADYIDAYYERVGNVNNTETNSSKGMFRKRLTATVAVLLASIYVTGVVADISDMVKKAITTKQPKIETPGKLFEVTPEVIANIAQTATPIVPQNTVAVQENKNSIDSVSQELNSNSYLASTLNSFSQNSQSQNAVGTIDSYQDFEALLQSDDDALYTDGPVYFANFSRQVVHSMLKDKYNAEKVLATYEKKGENNQIYEFHIRYIKDGSSYERSPDGRVDMTRGSDGRLQTRERHTLPNEMYEMLATIGEFSDYSSNGTFDIEGYALKYTNGDVEKAREEIKERMTYGTEVMKTLIQDRVRDDKVKELMGYDR